MRRSSSITSIDSQVERYITNDKYLDIVEVANNLAVITAVRNALTAIQSVNTNAAQTAAVAAIIPQLLAVEAALANVVAVGGSIANVNAIVPNLPNVNLVGGSITSVNNVAANIPDIDAIIANLGALNTIAGDLVHACMPAIMDGGFITDTNLDPNCTPTSILQTIFTNIANILAVAADLTNINIVANNKTNVDTVATNIANINTVASIQNLSNITTVANDLNAMDLNGIADVTTVANDLVLGANSKVVKVSTDIANVNAVGGSIANVNAVAADLANVNAVVANTTNVNTVATNIANVNTVAGSINNVNTFANTYYVSATAPTIVSHPTLSVGDLWYDTVNMRMMQYNGSVWEVGYNVSLASDAMTFTNKTLDSISNFIGADHVHYACRNTSGATITAGTIVTAQGTQGGTDYIEIVPVTNAQTQVALGILHTTLANNATGLVINTGLSTDVINTSGWPVGTILYPNNAGGLTSTKPTTGVYQACAVVLRSHANQGTMLVEFTEPKPTIHNIANSLGTVDFTLDLGGII